MTRLMRRHPLDHGIACLFLLALLPAIIAGCSPWPGGQQARVTSSPGASPASSPPPSGWTAVLGGMRFTDAAGAIGLMASAARPGRVAGCGLAARPGNAAVPTFALSDDAGHTWQTRPITGAQATKICYLFADTQQPDTFVTVWEGSESSAASVTSDAGRTWRSGRAICYTLA